MADSELCTTVQTHHFTVWLIRGIVPDRQADISLDLMLVPTMDAPGPLDNRSASQGQT